MKHIIQFSGGKDSLATLLYMLETNIDYEVIFCDTGWEAEETYEHIKDIEKELGISIKVLRSKYTFKSLSLKKKRVASTKARFCTEFLKVRPFIDYLLTINDDITIYQGIRAEESAKRRNMKTNEEFFKGYIDGVHSYRKNEIMEYIDKYSVDVFRPIFHWTANEVFDYFKVKKIAPNPLYKLGFSRVGCFPCIMCRHREIRQIVKLYPERINIIRDLENELGRSFFPPGYIPKWACKNKEYPFIDDVVSGLPAWRRRENKCSSVDLLTNAK